jgi:hypothetical protein
MYTGHCDVDEEGNEMVDNNESFESTMPDSSVHGRINFMDGKKEKIAVSFDNNKFDIAHIQHFITEAPVNGWQVTFPGDAFTEATVICESDVMFHKAFVYCMMDVSKYSHLTFDKIHDWRVNSC